MPFKLPFVASEADFVRGIQARDVNMERRFYDYCRKYYNATCGGIFSEDNVSHEDYFQDAFILVWTEIQNKRIHVVNDAIYRTQADGTDVKMTAKLKSYIMTIVRNQYIKSKRHVNIDIDNLSKSDILKVEDLLAYDSADKELKQQIIDSCVGELPTRCKEILTLFYYKNKSLDEILMIRQENTSKDGLKTAKSKCIKQLGERVLNHFTEYKTCSC